MDVCMRIMMWWLCNGIKLGNNILENIDARPSSQQGVIMIGGGLNCASSNSSDDKIYVWYRGIAFK